MCVTTFQSGFFLMVEGARIDHAHHDGFANRALEETLGFEEALAAVIKSLKDTNQLEEVKQPMKIRETLVID